MITTQTYVRKPLYVQAVQVTAENFNEVALWCQGDIQEISERGRPIQFIAVRVTSPMNPRQGQARVGDWILTSERGYKVYTPRAFEKAFDKQEDTGAAITMNQIEPQGYTAEQVQELLSATPDATRDSRVEDNAVGTGPMPPQPLPGDVEAPKTIEVDPNAVTFRDISIVPATPENIAAGTIPIDEENIVYPDAPETTA